MKKLLMLGATLAGAGYVLWQYWQQANAENARAWADGTDKVE